MPDWREGIGQTAVIEDINRNSWKQEFFDWQAEPFIYSGKGIDFRTDRGFGWASSVIFVCVIVFRWVFPWVFRIFIPLPYSPFMD